MSRPPSRPSAPSRSSVTPSLRTRAASGRCRRRCTCPHIRPATFGLCLPSAAGGLPGARVFGDGGGGGGHNGDVVHAVEVGALRREDVTQLGDVLAATA